MCKFILFFVLFFLSFTVHACQFTKALKHFHEQENQQAIESFNTCIMAKEQPAASHFYNGIAHRNMNQLDKSAVHLKKAVVLGPNQINHYLEYAYTMERQQKLLEALTVYNSALNLNKAHVGARLGQARLNHWLGHIGLSIKLYEALLLEHASNTAVQLGLGFALMSDKKLRRSQHMFEAVLNNDPDNISAKKGLNMLNNTHNYSVKIIWDAIDFDGKTITAQKLSLDANPSHLMKWGLNMSHYSDSINLFSEEGVLTNRSIVNEFSAYLGFKWFDDHELISALSAQRLSGNRYLYQAKIEDYYATDDQRQWVVGLTQSFIGSQAVNTLASVGLTVKTQKGLELVNRLFYSSDISFEDSYSFSSRLIKSYPNKNMLQIGASYNVIGSRDSTTFFALARLPLTKKIGVVAQLTKNNKDRYFQTSIGFNYDF